ncbi:MAG: formylglycine-generating enzyme family protein [Symploca sp. SIO3C6]|uniref:Formylglycine-generating enzyme family protein n=1 Tax=Symploca sp. SIO1C4 TaxID=2607765 RepID=A0A6B3NS64_9CYAN|nr:formylglycine-generating enzyme family protein [Symploca sp. SIO3C6]NER32038.1 formylglycine-generating enzyme family protein [Symploca sp. SIO1C4]NET05214.1 formylglycine-generating enzyme family protein [Symploca sp. SIO2B6]NET48582.1 formylglycine-generating enzyme family protein [Merismopedia sp. SIO2A8]
MVSSRFLASEFIAEHELPPLLKAAETEGLEIIWIYLSYCLYEETEIKAFQAAHNLSQPLDSLTFSEQNKALRDICRVIKTASLPRPEPKPDTSLIVTKNEQPTLDTFEFSVVSADAQGREISRRRQQAQQFTENLGYGVQLEMVAIEGGILTMGSPDSEAGRSDYEGPQHLVKVAPFFMGKYLITQAQWLMVAEFPQVYRSLHPNPSHFKGSNLPVEQISWYDAVEFCNRLSQHTGSEYRLPTEAQWEYACRAKTTSPYHFGEGISPELANYDNRKGTTPVGSFQVANNFGLYDMHGNIWEWCVDHWHNSYEGAPSDSRAWLGDDSHSSAIMRGGSWLGNPNFCRCAFRKSYGRAGRDLFLDDIGFRVVCAFGRTL